MGQLLCTMESTDETTDADSPESQGAAGCQGGAAEASGGPAAGGGHACSLVVIGAGLVTLPRSHSSPYLSLMGNGLAVAVLPGACDLKTRPRDHVCG